MPTVTKGLQRSHFKEFPTQSSKLGQLRTAGGWPVGESPPRTTQLFHESDPVSSYQFGALDGQSLIGMIVGISDLTIGDPDDWLRALSVAKRPLEHRTIDAITDVARQDLRRDRSSIGQDPYVGGEPVITGTMAVADDERIRGTAKQQRQRRFIDVHRSRLINYHHAAMEARTSSEGSFSFVGEESAGIAHRQTARIRPRAAQTRTSRTRRHRHRLVEHQWCESPRRWAPTAWFEGTTKRAQLFGCPRWSRGHRLGEDSSQYDGRVGVTTRQLLRVQEGRSERWAGERIHEASCSLSHGAKTRHPRWFDLSDAREERLLSPSAEHGHQETECFGPVTAFGDALCATLFRSVTQERHVEIKTSDERIEP